MNKAEDRYVPISRVFIEYSGSLRHRNAAETIARDLEYLDVLRWDELEHHRFVVVLGEPGSGKSTELRERVKVLRTRQQAAFFLRIEDFLDTSRLEGSSERILTEAPPGAPFHLFLDSVDEARLIDADAFRKTINNLADWLGDRIIDAHVVISCRLRDWRDDADINDIDSLFLARLPESRRSLEEDRNETDVYGSSKVRRSIATPLQEKTLKPVVVTLAPLSRELVIELVGGLKCPNTPEFVAQLDDRQAWSLAYRPIDAIALLDYWDKNKSLGTYTKLLDYSIDVRIRESNWHHSRYRTLTQSKARDGAEKLAAAVVLCRKNTIEFRLNELLSEDDAILDPQRILVDWTYREIQNLLSTALFEGVSRSRVSFYHKSAAEFMASKWIFDLRAVVGSAAIKGVLFEEVYERFVAVSQREPLVAWLAPYEKSIEQATLNVAPEILMEFGDPGRFQLAEKQAVLDRFVEKFRTTSIVPFEFTRASIKRFSEPGLTTIIEKHIADTRLSEAVRLQLVEVAKLADLDVSAALKSIILSDKESINIRVKAIIAFGALSSTDSQNLVAKEIATTSEIDNSIIAAAVRTFYPTSIGVDVLLELLGKTQSIPSNHIGGIDYVMEKVAEKVVPTQDLGLFIQGLVTLVDSRDLLTRDRETKGEWLLETIVIALVRYLSELKEGTVDLQLALDAIRTLERDSDFQYSSKIDRAKVREAVGKHASLNRKLFWNKIYSGESYWGLASYTLWQLTVSDLDWLLDDLETFQTDLEKIKVLLNAAWFLPTRSGGLDQLVSRIQKQFADNTQILENLEERRQGQARAEAEWKEQDAKQRARELEREQQKAKELEILSSRIEKMRSGEDFPALFHVAINVKDANRFSDITYLQAKEKYGPEIAEAAVSGWKTTWRKYIPPLDHEKAEKNRIENEVIIGLAGLTADVNDGLELLGLSEPEVVTLTRYASRELNGFPFWFPALISVRPEIVLSTLNPQVQYEYCLPIGQENYPTLLASIANSSSEICRVFGETIIGLLESGEPENEKVLHEALAIVMKSGEEFSGRLRDLAAERVSSGQVEHDSIQWLIIWLSIDADASLNYLEKLRTTVNIDPLIEKLAAAFGRPYFHYSIPGDPDFNKMPYLARLATLVYDHVRIVDDIRRPPGGFTPVSRDDAQSFRSGLLERLANTPGREAYLALKGLLENPTTEPIRDWIGHLLEQKAAKDADSFSWDVDDLLEFEFGRKTFNGGLRIDSVRIECTGREETTYHLHERLNIFVGADGSGRTSALNHFAVSLLPIVAGLTSRSPNDIFDESFSKVKNGFTLENQTIRVQAQNMVSWATNYGKLIEENTSFGQDSPYRYCTAYDYTSVVRSSVRKRKRYNWPVIAYYQSNRTFPPEHDSNFPGDIRSGLKRLTISALNANITLNSSLHVVFSSTDARLIALRQKAITSLLPTGKPAQIDWNGLGAGFKAFFSLIFDIGLRMYRVNEHLDEPFLAEGIILIDDIDLYVTPLIQKKLIDILLALFPNVQFVVSVNNPLTMRSVPKYGAKVIRLPDRHEFQEDFNAWDVDTIIDRLFSVQVGRRKTIDEDLQEFEKICGDPDQVDRAYAIYSDLMETGSTEIAAELSLSLALYGSDKLRAMILSAVGG